MPNDLCRTTGKRGGLAAARRRPPVLDGVVGVLESVWSVQWRRVVLGLGQGRRLMEQASKPLPAVAEAQMCRPMVSTFVSASAARQQISAPKAASRALHAAQGSGSGRCDRRLNREVGSKGSRGSRSDEEVWAGVPYHVLGVPLLHWPSKINLDARRPNFKPKVARRHPPAVLAWIKGQSIDWRTQSSSLI